jgi:hypothetical protein
MVSKTYDDDEAILATLNVSFILLNHIKHTEVLKIIKPYKVSSYAPDSVVSAIQSALK